MINKKLLDKTRRVIESCQTQEQLNTALRYAALAAKHASTYPQPSWGDIVERAEFMKNVKNLARQKEKELAE